jgi:cyanophycinase
MTPKGKLIAIGGNEDKGKEPEAGHNTKVFTHKFIEEGILRRVVDEIGGPEKRIAVITSASSIPEEVGQNYIEAFGRLGATNIDIMDIRDRSDVKPDMIKRLAKCDGVMMSGGNQLRLTTIFGGTAFLQLMKRRSSPRLAS